VGNLLVHRRKHLKSQIAAKAARVLRVSNYQLTNLPTYQLQSFLSGFTIIELLVVIAIIAILATMGMAQYRRESSTRAKPCLKTDLFDLRDANRSVLRGQETSIRIARRARFRRYLRKIPVDPFTNAADTWQTVPSEADPNNPTASPGIYDVKSGSDGCHSTAPSTLTGRSG